jgi:hypothetical protein
MQRAIAGSVSAFVSIFLVTALAQAQVADHLKCYKYKDPLKLKGPPPFWLNLEGSQFPPESCKIVGGFRLFCVPVTKEVTATIQGKSGAG